MAAVGNLPGVPALLTGFSAALSVTQNPIVRDVLSGLSIPIGAKWGIYSAGIPIPIIVCDTVVDMSFKQDYVVADYPIEKGGFVSYDKVFVPFETRVRFVAGGSIFNMQQQSMLDSIRAISGDTKLYDVVTPVATYDNCNIKHYDYHRSVQNGLGVLAVDVWLTQIRIVAPASVSTSSAQNTVSPSGTSSISGGESQATPATPAQQDLALTSEDKKNISGALDSGPGTYTWITAK